MKPEHLPPNPFVRRNAEFFAFGGLRILDVGCAYGRNALFLAKLGHTVIALNNDEAEITVARNEAVARGVDVQFDVADARQPFRHGMFDVVLCNEMLHQVPQEDRVKVIRNIQTVTNPGGVNLVSDYIGDKPQALNPFWLYDQYSADVWEREYIEESEQMNTTGAVAELTSKAYLRAVKH